MVTLAHLQTRATRKDPQARFDAKWKLVQLLYRRGWEKQRIIDLFFVLDWMMSLPEALTKQLWQNVVQLEQEKKMKYVSTGEQIGLEKGLQQGLQLGLQQGLEQGLEKGLEKGLEQGLEQGEQQGEAKALQKLLVKRFGAIPAEAASKISNASSEQIDAWLDKVLDAPSLQALLEPTRH